MELADYQRQFGRESAPGWDAIDAALSQIYGHREPDRHIVSIPKYALGGPDPLDGISIYQREDHLHYVSYGMSELYYDEETLDSDYSGWGFEFTFRLRLEPSHDLAQDEAPLWPTDLMQNLAKYVLRSERWFEKGHYVDAGGPIKTSSDSEFQALMFAEDPELGTIFTPHGRVEFLQIVGLTRSEHSALVEGTLTSAGVTVGLREGNPLLVTSLARR